MFQKLNSLLIAVLTAALLAGCGGQCPKTETKNRTYKHVILIGSDGFSSEIMHEHPGKFPRIEQLIKEGSYTFESRSVLPSSSAINWATMLMGAGSEMHGFTDWGSKTPEAKPAYLNKYGIFPGIFGEVREQKPEAVTGVLYSWDGIGYLFEKEAVNLDRFVTTDDSIAMESVKFIQEQKPTLAFVYFAEPDGAGHNHGWLSPEYVAACEKIDSLVGVVVDGVRSSMDMKETAIIFTSDHGGINTGHGGKTMQEMEVPFVMVGENIPVNRKIESIVMKYDVAPTIAEMLGIDAPEQWRGKSCFMK